MAIPDYETIMLPILKLLSDNKERSREELRNYISAQFRLTDEENNKLLPSGRITIIQNRVGWAITYLKKALLIESPKRAILRISNRGQTILKSNPSKITKRLLLQFPEFVEFQKISKEPPTKKEEVEETETPEEMLEKAYLRINGALANDILTEVKKASPKFFERLVVELLLEMGYGGSREDAGQAIGQSGDEGIDGIIKEDKLGLDIIYIQAKRWENNVTRPEIQKFAGALQGQRAKKGIFITTSSFSRDAREYVSKIDSKIILIDGEKLAQLMLEYDVGVHTTNSFDIKKLDLDYFNEE